MICQECGREYRIGEWPWCGGSGQHGRPHGKQGGVVHPQERSVVYRHPGTGKVAYAPRNDVPMPDRYRRWGYVREELPTLRDVERFEKQENVRSEVAWMDSGTGRGHDDHSENEKPIDLTGLEFTPLGS